jgi:hypothetical protein
MHEDDPEERKETHRGEKCGLLDVIEGKKMSDGHEP